MISYHHRYISVVVAASMIVGGCATKQGTGQVIGSLLAGGLCLALVDQHHKGACLAAAAAGFAVGGAIGRRMDERDRILRNQALRAALYNDNLWAGKARRPLSGGDLQGMPPPDWQPNRNNMSEGGVEWYNPATSNAGRIEPLSDFAGNNTECRQFRETYFIRGEPVTDTATVCRGPNGQWADI